MNEALKKLVERSRNAAMPAEEREAQRRSFAFGNTHFENDLITRSMIDSAAERLAAGRDGVADVIATVKKDDGH